jgi:hypothetical protein
MLVVIWLLLAAAQQAQPEVDMSLASAVVHRPLNVADREAFKALAEGVVVLASLPEKPSELAEAFAGAVATGRSAPNVSLTSHLLATGPILDGPDRVLPHRLIRRGSQFELEILHTAVRLQDAQLRRNIIWRPLVEVPLSLSPGSYSVRVTWRAVTELPNGEPLESSPRVHSMKFVIQARN